MMSKGSMKAGIALFLALVILFMYANSDHEIALMGHTLKKNKDLKIIDQQPIDKSDVLVTDLKANITVSDSNIMSYDTSNKKILLFGDSQAEGLMYPLSTYTRNSGHDLVLAFPWYSASDITYASNDTLKQVIQRYKPDYIIAVIGLNQILQTNLDPSIDAIKEVLQTIGDIPFSWVGPANWVEDKGINKVYQENLPLGTFFLSKDLPLPRGADGRHPNNEGYKIWMDTIATWLNNSAKWKIRMLKPEFYKPQRSFPIKTLNASRRANKEIKKEKEPQEREKVDTVQHEKNEKPR